MLFELLAFVLRVALLRIFLLHLLDVEKGGCGRY